MRVDATVPKAPLQSQDWGIWAMAWGTVQGHPFYPRHCCYGLPCLGPLLPPFPTYVSGVLRTAHTLVWEPGLSIYLELALHSLTQGRRARDTPSQRAPNVIPTLLV